MATKRTQRKESGVKANASSVGAGATKAAAGMSAATLGLVLAAVGSTLGYLFATDQGANMRRSISKRADALMKSYERGMTTARNAGSSRGRGGRMRTAGAAA